MNKIFEDDNPLLAFLSVLADLIILNLLTLFSCVPIVTIGASLTAAHYTALKMRRGESHILSDFWKSFKENFKQSTVIWIVFAVYIVLVYLAFVTLSTGEGGTVSGMQGALIAAVVFSLAILLWVIPLQARFVNSIWKTLRLAFFMTFKHLFRTIAMLIVSAVPFLLSFNMYSVLLLFGFAVPIYLNVFIYNGVFVKLEKSVEEQIYCGRIQRENI